MGAQKHFVIIGANAAGLKAASKARRRDSGLRITVLHKGKFISYAACGIPYYVGGVIPKQEALYSNLLGMARTPQFFQKMKDLEILTGREVTAIDRKKKKITGEILESGGEFSLDYDKLLIATGAHATVPPIPGTHLQNIHTMQTIEDAEALLGLVGGGTRGVIVGGGFIGLEAAESLVARGVKTTLIEKLDQVMYALDYEMSVMVKRHLISKGVDVRTSEGVVEFRGDDSGNVQQVVTEKGVIDADFVVLGMGVKPNVALAQKAGLKLGKTGAIKVNQHMQTSDPDIYAAGDCVEVMHLVSRKPVFVPLGSTANKQGRVVGMHVTGGRDVFPGVLGTLIFKTFEMNVGRTGLNEREARAMGYDIETAIVPGPDHAHYYPSAKLIAAKLVAERKNGRLLGAQVVGMGDVDKRVDVFASLINAGADVHSINNIDLCYAPPYSSPIGPALTAINVLRNKLIGDARGIPPMAVQEKRKNGNDFVFLDVRNKSEYDEVHIEGTKLIPLGQLKERLSELPRDKEIVTFCKISLRGYEACKILDAAGFTDTKYMDGGVVTWPFDLAKGDGPA